MTFYEALDEFEDRYLAAIAVESKRVIDLFDQEWQTINNEYQLYQVAYSEGKTAEAQAHIQNILDILTDNGIIVTEPVSLPLPVSVNTVPSTVPISCDSTGTPIAGAYTNTYSVVTISLGNVDDTANWVYTITDQTGATATNLTLDNQIDITSITADSGTIEVTCAKAGYDDFVLDILTYKVYADFSGDYYTKVETDAGFVAVTGVQTAAGAKTWSDQGVFSNGALMATGSGNGIYWGDGDLGFEELTDDELTMQGTYLQGSAIASFRLANETSSYTNPVYASKYDSLSGIGFGAAQSVSVIAFGTEAMRTTHLATDFNLPINVNDDLTADNLISEGDVSLAADISQTGTATSLGIDPYQVLDIGEVTNNANFRVNIYNGDGTSTVNHILEGSGASYLCRGGDDLSIGHTGVPRGQIDIIDSGGVGNAYMPADGGWHVKRNLSTTAAAMVVDNSAGNRLLHVQCDRRIGINTSSPANHACFVYSEETTGAKADAPLAVDMAASSSGLEYLVSFTKADGATNCGGITFNSGVLALAQPSDSSLKEDIEDTGINSTALLKDIKIKDFKFKEDKDKKKVTGYVADENIDKIEGFAFEDDGLHYVAPVVLIPYLHKAFQELDKRLTALEGA